MTGKDDQILKDLGVDDLPAVVVYNRSGTISGRSTGITGHAEVTQMIIEADKQR